MDARMDLSNYIVALNRDERNSQRYKFLLMEKINNGVITSPGKNTGMKIKSNLNTFDLNLWNCFAKELNSIMSGDKTNGCVLIGPLDYTSDLSQIKFVMSEYLLSYAFNKKCMSETELISSLLMIFSNIKHCELYESGGKKWLRCYLNDKIELADKAEVRRICSVEEIKKDKQPVMEEAKEVEQTAYPDLSKFNPDEIISKLKKKIIAQDKAIEDVVDTVLLNQLVVDMNDPDVLKTSKSNILLDGPTGTGKTFILKEVVDTLNLPMVIISATSLSSTGYKGNNLDTILISLLNKANGNVELAQRGIVVLDEFDKLGVSNDGDAIRMRQAVQEELLTYITGTVFDINYNGQTVSFDTSKLTFVGLGAFTALRESKIGEKTKTSIGFMSKSEKDESSDEKVFSISPDDYVRAGLARELVGRFTTLTYTNPIDKAGLIRIMKESETSPLLFVKKIAESNRKKLIISDEVIEYVADKALEMNTGARALQTVFNPIQRMVAREILNTDNLEVVVSKEMLDSLDDLKVRRY